MEAGLIASLATAMEYMEVDLVDLGFSVVLCGLVVWLGVEILKEDR